MARITNYNSYSGKFSEDTEKFVADTFGVVLASFAGDWTSLVTEEHIRDLIVKVEVLSRTVEQANERAEESKNTARRLRDDMRAADAQRNENFETLGELLGTALKAEAVKRQYCGEFEESVGKMAQLLRDNSFHVTADTMEDNADRRKKFKVEVEVLAMDQWGAADAVTEIAYNSDNPLVSGTSRVLPSTLEEVERGDY